MQLVPYASIYLGPDGHIGGEARDRIGGFWRAIGIELPQEVDHLSVMLACHTELVQAEAAAPSEELRQAARHRRRAFLYEHLASWLPIYLDKLDHVAPPFYRAWGELLSETLVAEMKAVETPSEDSLHLRLARGLPRGSEGDRDELLQALLAPVRAGFILTRQDLAQAARELGIGSRIGERRFMLEAMLKQRPTDLGDWLETYCERVLVSYRALSGGGGRLRYWTGRVEESRRRLRGWF